MDTVDTALPWLGIGVVIEQWDIWAAWLLVAPTTDTYCPVAHRYRSVEK
jgi:hypothetical protein